jgi:hypothetical protein
MIGLSAPSEPCFLRPVTLPWAGHAFDFVHFNTPGAQIERYAIVRFLASVTGDRDCAVGGAAA